MEEIQTLSIKFRLLEQSMGLKLLRRAGLKAGKLLRDYASANAPVKTGKLRDSIKAGTRKETESSIQVWVGPKKAFYGRFIEFGVRPHKVTARSARVLADMGTGEVFGVGAKHPGIPARPFLRKAIDEHGDEAATVFAVEIEKEILKAFNQAFASD